MFLRQSTITVFYSYAIISSTVCYCKAGPVMFLIDGLFSCVDRTTNTRWCSTESVLRTIWFHSQVCDVFIIKKSCSH